MRTSVAFMLAAMALLAGPASAQTSAAPDAGQSATGPAAGTFIAQQREGTMRLSKLRGIDVIGQDHTKIGDVEDVLVDRNGAVSGAVVEVGGFLGLGGKKVAMRFTELHWNTLSSEVASSGGSASTGPRNTPSAEQAASAGAERMPGANISDRVLNAVPEGRSGVVDPSTGPVTTGSTPPATVPVMGPSGASDRAFVFFTKDDLRNAPEFRYLGER
jgi:sporulation protein YlmC with PRC-barrel domain